jgi:TatD DNase family protein
MPADFWDTHAHLHDEQFGPDLPVVLERARQSALQGIIEVAVDVQTSHEAVRLARERRGFVWAAVGIHPHNAAALAPDGSWLKELARLAKEDETVAIGEIGLDFYRNLAPREAQAAAFRAQLRLAGELGKPAIIHSRAALAEVLALFAEEGTGVRAVLHCFSGDESALRQAIGLGLYVSFAGPLTFPNANALRSLAAQTPADRLLLETDSPYMAPEPYRGRRNEPAYVRFVAEALARARGVSLEEISAQTCRNVESFFAFPG